MKRILFSALIIAILLISSMSTLSILMPSKRVPQYSDEKLRELALSKGLKPIPNSFEKLLALVDDEKNPMSVQKILLGAELFFDTNLSKSKKISCATCHSFTKERKKSHTLLNKLTKDNQESISDCAACHLQDQSGVDRFTFSQGDSAVAHPYLLNTQSILNVSLAKHFTWSGEVKSIRLQSENSLQAHHKMNSAPKEIEAALALNPYYITKFQEVFKDGITFQNSAKAIEAYVKTLVTRGAYDRFLEGDNSAISSEAKRGLANFINFGCKGCHNDMSLGGQTIQKFPLRGFAKVNDLKLNFEIFPEFKIYSNQFPFPNDGGFLGKNSEYLFRVPILRNVTKTSPYFHSGSVPKIREAVDIMARHQLGRHLTLQQIDEIVAFFQTLEGDIVDYKLEEDKSE